MTETSTSANAVLDIRKVPVSELQTRDGREVVFLVDDTARYEQGANRVAAIVRDICGRLIFRRYAVNGLYNQYGQETSEDIVRKKQLKGRVLYRSSYGRLCVTDGDYTEKTFNFSFRAGDTFLRILTEVPEFPTEEV